MSVLNALSGTAMFSVPAGIVTVVRLVHCRKAPDPMLSTPLPIMTLVRLPQPPKASAPMLVTELGMMIVVRLLQPMKTPFGRSVMLPGSEALSSPAHPEKLA